MVAHTLTRLPALPVVLSRARVARTALAIGLATGLWICLFGYLAVVRHLAGGTHAEDLGFTDQVIWNFLRGQWFRMSIYNGATWNTELDLSQLARPDSLLAFHVEPMLLLFVPLYALGAGPLLLLVIQAVAFGLGAIPAYRLGSHFSGHSWGGAAVASAYLLSPLGQSAVLSDFHTSTLAAPLLVLAAERVLVARSTLAGMLAAGLALTAREDLGPAVALLGISLLLLGGPRRPMLLLSGLGVLWTVVATAVLLHYNGGVSPFAARYSASLVDPLATLVRPDALRTYVVFLLGGGWLGVVSPTALLGAVPTLLANVLSGSSWMASSSAHYGTLLLPFSTLGVAVSLRHVHGRALGALCALLVVSAAVVYLREGSGPLAANYSPAYVTAHARLAKGMANSLPPDAAVSASSTLVPHLSHRAALYLFPTVRDADYVFVDARATSAPTSPGDVFLRVRDMLRGGGWQLAAFTDGLVLLRRDEAAPPYDLPQTPSGQEGTALVEPRLIDAVLVPSSDGAIDVDGPRWILRTTWQIDRPLPADARLDFWLDLSSGERVHVWDIASLWWNPPARWVPGQPLTVDIPDVPVRRFVGWRAVFTSDT